MASRLLRSASLCLQLTGVFAALLALGLCSPLHAQDMTVIKHIVFMVQENRSFDVYFGAFPGADGASTALLSNGQRVSRGHLPDSTPLDICHDWKCTISD